VQLDDFLSTIIVILVTVIHVIVIHLKVVISPNHFFMNSVALISNTRKMDWFCNHIDMCSNDSSFSLHLLVSSLENCSGFRARLKPRRQLGVSLSRRCIDNMASVFSFFFPRLRQTARFFLAWRVCARQTAREAACFILPPAAMVLNANFGPAGRRALTVESFTGYGRTGDRICVRIARDAQMDGQTKWFAVAWTHSRKWTALQLRDVPESHVMTITFNNERSHLPPALAAKRYDFSNYFYTFLIWCYGLFECIKVHDISYVQGRVLNFNQSTRLS